MEGGSRLNPYIELQLESQNEDVVKEFILKRAYICRRAITNLPFMFDVVAHSAQLFDAFTPEQERRKDTTNDEKSCSKPVSQIMFERIEDHIDPETKRAQPHIVIREVKIGQPYRLWYQKPPQTALGSSKSNTHQPTASWYQFDGRSYECFDLDNYYWTKQIRGVEVDITVAGLMELAKSLIQDPYDIGRHTCHDAREVLMVALGVDKPRPRAFTRMTEFLRPQIVGRQGIVASASRSSSSANG